MISPAKIGRLDTVHLGYRQSICGGISIQNASLCFRLPVIKGDGGVAPSDDFSELDQSKDLHVPPFSLCRLLRAIEALKSITEKSKLHESSLQGCGGR